MDDPSRFPGADDFDGIDPVFLSYIDPETQQDAYDYVDFFNPELFSEGVEELPVLNSDEIQQLLADPAPAESVDYYIDNFNPVLFGGGGENGDISNQMDVDHANSVGPAPPEVNGKYYFMRKVILCIFYVFPC